MIKVYKGLEDYKELCEIVGGIKNLDTFVKLIKNNPNYDVTNDLRETDSMIDVNFKHICATIKGAKHGLSVVEDVEVWDEDGTLDFISVDMYEYNQYVSEIRDDGYMQVSSIHPYDEQKYHYAVGNKIYRDGKYVETITPNNKIMIDGIDEIKLRLMELDRPLQSKICHY